MMAGMVLSITNAQREESPVLRNAGLVTIAAGRALRRLPRHGRYEPDSWDYDDLLQTAWLKLLEFARDHDPSRGALSTRFYASFIEHSDGLIWLADITPPLDRSVGPDGAQRARVRWHTHLSVLADRIKQGQGERNNLDNLLPPVFDTAVERQEGEEFVQRFLATLDPTARAVASLRWDMETGETLRTQAEIAKVLGINPRTVFDAINRVRRRSPTSLSLPQRKFAKRKSRTPPPWVKEMLDRLDLGERAVELAAEYGVSRTQLSKLNQRYGDRPLPAGARR